MRQAWINKLREMLAELTSACTHYRVAGIEGRPGEEGAALILLVDHIRLMLNPKEDDHQRLEEQLHEMVGNIADQKANKDEFLKIREKGFLSLEEGSEARMEPCKGAYTNRRSSRDQKVLVAPLGSLPASRIAPDGLGGPERSLFHPSANNLQDKA